MLWRKLSTRLWRTSGWLSAWVARLLRVTLSCATVALSPCVTADSPDWPAADSEDFFACSAATNCGSVVFNPILITTSQFTGRHLSASCAKNFNRHLYLSWYSCNYFSFLSLGELKVTCPALPEASVEAVLAVWIAAAAVRRL